MCFCAGSFILIGEVILYLIRHFFRHIFMMKKLEDGLCLLHVDTEELTVLVDALRVKGFMKGFFNFETITFFDLFLNDFNKRSGFRRFLIFGRTRSLFYNLIPFNAAANALFTGSSASFFCFFI